MNFDKPCSRKNFFSAFARQAGEVVVSLAEIAAEAGNSFKEPVVAWTRPPGALPEVEFLAACTNCDDCATACPYGVILQSDADTPIIMPAVNPCVLCEGLPCIDACKTGALVRPS